MVEKMLELFLFFVFLTIALLGVTWSYVSEPILNTLALAGDLHGFLERTYVLNRGDGPIHFRLVGRDGFLVHDPEQVTSVYKSKDFGRNPQDFTWRLKRLIGNNIITADNSEWHAMRVRQLKYFDTPNLKEYFNTTHHVISVSRERFENAAKSQYPVNITQEMMLIATRAAFCSFLDCEPEEVTDELCQSVRIVFNEFRDNSTSLMPPVPFFIQTPHNRKVLQHRQVIYDFIDRHLPNAKPGSVLSKIITHHQSNTQAIREELIAFLIGGSETTISFLTWLCYHLIQNPRIQHKLHEEIDAVGKINFESMSKMQYLQACLDETLRLHSPAGFSCFCALTKTYIGGVYIPKGSLVFMSQEINHKTVKFWSDSLDFVPERWFEERQGAFHPFGGGATSCIGKKFSYQEAKLLTVMLLQNFNLRQADSKRLKSDRKVTIRPDGALFAFLTHRQ
jgi:cytochrome P450